ncbi:NIPSNAP family protein [Oceanicoccus sagamiensis]|uniref:NIPSNAP domain-containing protein n=1 Tax=Oceanicoccus sagamiensis TaxID=716816 RepID=A0A1X9NCW2_9GAMM|nr:NIPSNAP family protein [Oceanicoccus sagamiensis]ARN75870.1 hypothetical protein BST96_18230 [Oceanicoccus sagamiensis]
MIEIRNYHIAADAYSAYKHWAEYIAVPYLKQQLPMIGFWLNDNTEVEVLGEAMDAVGPANVTWILEWDSMEQRNEQMAAAFTGERWDEVFAKLEGGFDIYVRRETRFCRAI